MENRKCGKCEFFEGATKRPRKGFKLIYGVCKRFPPMIANIWDTRDSITQYEPAGFCYPQVHSDKWCGEFKTVDSDNN